MEHNNRIHLHTRAGTVPVIWLIFSFMAITTLAHVGYCFNPVNISTWRWLEYSITSTIMVFVLSMMSGVMDVYALTCIVVCNFTMIATGWVLDLSLPLYEVQRKVTVNSTKQIDSDDDSLISEDGYSSSEDEPSYQMTKPKTFKQKNGEHNLLKPEQFITKEQFSRGILKYQPYLPFGIFALGTIAGLAPWICIFISIARLMEREMVPFFVLFSTIGLFFQFFCFGFHELAHIYARMGGEFSCCCCKPRDQTRREWYIEKKETVYMVLSLVAKSFLSWSIFIGLLIN